MKLLNIEPEIIKALGFDFKFEDDLLKSTQGVYSFIIGEVGDASFFPTLKRRKGTWKELDNNVVISSTPTGLQDISALLPELINVISTQREGEFFEYAQALAKAAFPVNFLLLDGETVKNQTLLISRVLDTLVDDDDSMVEEDT